MTTVEFVEHCSVTLVDKMGDDHSIVQAALVSTTKDPLYYDNPLRLEGLIRRLMSDRHGSPFEQVVFKFWVDCPLMTMRQLQRHRIASWNEVSGRYRVLEPRFYAPPEGRPMIQEPGSKAMDYATLVDEEVRVAFRRDVEEGCREAWDRYERAIGMGVVRELARGHLPPFVMTQAMLEINLRSLLNLLSLRAHGVGRFPSHPQHEIAECADLMELEVARVVPVAHQAFVDAGRVAP